jgi:hypothetical protein
LRTRFRCGCACAWLNLAAREHSSAHSTKGTPSPIHPRGRRLRPAGSAWFQGLFHSPHRGAFHRSLTVLVHYRSSAVFSLGGWAPPLQSGSRVSGPTHDPAAPDRRVVRLRVSHPLRTPVPAGFASTPQPGRGGCRPLPAARPTPHWHRRQAVPPARFGLLPVRSPLLRESSLLLGVLRCFSSPGAPLRIAPQVPGRAPGGLPHSETPGSQAASASPGHVAAWPRPSSAAQASSMRPSLRWPTESRLMPHHPNGCWTGARQLETSRLVSRRDAPEQSRPA